MSRNKYPQETIGKILDTAQQLFLSKGYEYTSIQDIIDGLGGLTKGAIYHHFKSKEAILASVVMRLFADAKERMKRIVSDPNLTGREKLVLAVQDCLEDPTQDYLFEVAPNILKNPWMLAALLQDCFSTVVPDILQPIVEQGIEDGSICTQHPKELAQVMSILCNVWINPTVCHGSKEEVVLRMRLLNQLMEPFGLDVMDDRVIERVLNYQRLHSEKNPHSNVS